MPHLFLVFLSKQPVNPIEHHGAARTGVEAGLLYQEALGHATTLLTGKLPAPTGRKKPGPGSPNSSL